MSTADAACVTPMAVSLFASVHCSVIVAPFGSTERRFSTAPYCVGVPIPGHAPLVLDFATSVVAEGKVLVASQGGKAIPGNALIGNTFIIALVTAVHFTLQWRDSVLDARRASQAVLAFWLAYILTRPLGASIGDYLSQPTGDGGLGLGTVVTSVIFLAAILTMVVFLSITRVDRTEPADDSDLVSV